MISKDDFKGFHSSLSFVFKGFPSHMRARPTLIAPPRAGARAGARVAHGRTPINNNKIESFVFDSIRSRGCGRPVVDVLRECSLTSSSPLPPLFSASSASQPLSLFVSLPFHSVWYSFTSLYASHCVLPEVSFHLSLTGLHLLASHPGVTWYFSLHRACCEREANIF